MSQTLAFQINKVTYYFTTRLHIFRAMVKPSDITTMLLMLLLLLCVPCPLSVFLYYLQQMNQFSSIDSRCLLLSTFLLLSKASGDWIYIHLSLVEEGFLLHQPKKRDFLSKEIVYYIHLYNTLLWHLCPIIWKKMTIWHICNDCFKVEIIILQCTFFFIFSTLYIIVHLILENKLCIYMVIRDFLDLLSENIIPLEIRKMVWKIAAILFLKPSFFTIITRYVHTFRFQ